MVRLLFKGKTVLLVVSENVLKTLFWFFNGLLDEGKEQTINTKIGEIYEFETDDMSPDMLDTRAVMSMLTPSKQGKENPDRVLSQEEIDKLINSLGN